MPILDKINLNGTEYDIGGTPYVLPTMSATVKGGARLGSGLSVDNDTLSVDTSVIATNERVTTIRESMDDVIGTETPSGTTPINFDTTTGELPPTEDHPEYNNFGYYVFQMPDNSYRLCQFWWYADVGLKNVDVRLGYTGNRTHPSTSIFWKCNKTNDSSKQIYFISKLYDTSGNLLRNDTASIIPQQYNQYAYNEKYMLRTADLGSGNYYCNGNAVGIGVGFSMLPIEYWTDFQGHYESTVKPNSFAFTINGNQPLTSYQMLSNNVATLYQTVNNKVSVNIPQSTETSYPTVSEFNALLTALKNAGLMVADS